MAATSSKRLTHTAIVIGAGMSGLSCARELVNAGVDVLILEARDRIGGRTWTYQHDRDHGKPLHFDLGASFIHGIAGNPLYRFANKHGIPLYVMHDGEGGDDTGERAPSDQTSSSSASSTSTSTSVATSSSSSSSSSSSLSTSSSTSTTDSSSSTEGGGRAGSHQHNVGEYYRPADTGADNALADDRPETANDEETDALQRSEGVYSPEGPLLEHKLAARLNFNVTRAFFSDSATYAQDSPNTVPNSVESLGDWMKDETRSTLFAGLDTDRDRGYARALAESWEGYTGAALDDVSLRYWHSEVTFRGPDATIVNGYAGIYTRLHDEVVRKKDKHGHALGEVRLNEVVDAISLADDEETVIVTTRAGGKERKYTAQHVVCTIPLGVLQHSPPRFTPPLPRRRLDATQRLGHGLLNKIIVAYPHCFWPTDVEYFAFLPSKLSEAFLPVLKTRSLLIQNLKLINGQNALLFFMGGKSGEELEEVSDEYVREHIHRIIVHHFGPHVRDVPSAPEAVIVTRWRSDPFARGSYSFLKPSEGPAERGDMHPSPQDFRELARPLWGDKLLFAGEATDPDHYVSLEEGQR